MASLSEQLATLANPTPDFGDPELADESSAAKLTDKFTEDDIDEEDWGAPLGKSIRRKTTGLLSDSDKKYAGKKTSRNDVSEDENMYDVEEDGDDEDKISVEEEEEEEEGEDDRSGEVSQFGDDDDDDDDDDDEEDDDNDEEDDEDNEKDEETSGGSHQEKMRSFSERNVAEEVAKGEATKKQLALFDSFLELRIKLQKLLTCTNQMPLPTDWSKLEEAGGKPYLKAMKQGQAAVNGLLEQLVDLQAALLSQNPQTSYIVKSSGRKRTKSRGSDDESIASDEDAEEEEEEQEEEQPKKKRKLKEYPHLISDRHHSFQKFRNETIQKWFDKTRVASGKLSKGFSAFDQSTLKQIEQILSDKKRLVLRTQLRRSAYHILGMPEQAEEADIDNNEPEDDEAIIEKNYNAEIFDDDDFYHLLLRELIQRKSMDLNDPLAIANHYSEIRKMRNKAKKQVDSRNSKDRKVKYDIHSKLMNFMAPNDVSSWTDEAKDELYMSLFGKIQAKIEEVNR
ncbi:hypothetical protein CAPTEDRAFT_110234 [Capitella teleta]|uniref:Protein AATF n=1 Tax=Capitella teleta TaxID=283909 RepID=R7TE75_CAPTE|nr:hypothetical protein CAPTEDRAFT_110234 [Capitella teleta]|eukprot:ELT89767.1 hypothetical protein CAPTEDRAFT_110234 [Capitella teleta]